MEVLCGLACVGLTITMVAAILDGERKRRAEEAAFAEAAEQARALTDHLRRLAGDQDPELAKDGTKRPRNLCLACGDGWYPRGQDKSDRCRKCGDEVGVILATPQVVANLPQLRTTYSNLRTLSEQWHGIDLERTD